MKGIRSKVIDLGFHAEMFRDGDTPLPDRTEHGKKTKELLRHLRQTYETCADIFLPHLKAPT